jgi:hypothetical protein
MKIPFLYSKTVVLKNGVQKFLFILSFRWYRKPPTMSPGLIYFRNRFLMGLYKGGGGANTWTIFCVSNKQVRHKQVTHKQENKHVLFNNTAFWFTLSAIKTMTMFLNIVLCYIKRQCLCWITYVVGTGLIYWAYIRGTYYKFGGAYIRVGLYSGGGGLYLEWGER